MTVAPLPYVLVFPALVLHQAEEYIWPGGFAAWINRDVFGRAPSEGLFTRRLALIINVPLAWPLALLASWHGANWIALTLPLCGILFVNSWFHSVLAITKLRYNPGVVTSVLVILPLMLWIIVASTRDHFASLTELFISLLCGLLFHIAVTTLPRLSATRTR